MVRCTALSHPIELIDGQWQGEPVVADLVSRFERLYQARPQTYSPNPTADFLRWLGTYIPVEDVEIDVPAVVDSLDVVF